MSRHVFTLLFVAISLLSFRSFAQTFEWAGQFGGALGETRAVAIDDEGNVYSTGYFSGTVDFDPGTDIRSLTSNPDHHDVFVTKLDNDGNLVWVKIFGGSSDDMAYALALDEDGSVYVTGEFGGIVDFNPGSETFHQTASDGASDVYINKLDNDGNFIWARQFAGNAASVGYAITVDTSGNVYTAGYLQYSADFDPGPNEFILSAIPSGGDIFISKLNASGNFVWAKQMGGASSMDTNIDMAKSVAVDGAGNVYTTGIFENTADFDPGADTFNLVAAGGYDVFVSKLDANGNFVWAKQIGGPGFDFGEGIAVTSDGIAHITGYFKETADVDPGPAIKNFTSAGEEDIFTVQLDADGNLVWASQQGGAERDCAFKISLDDDQNVYTTGHFYGTSDFNPGSETFNLTVAGSADLFVSKLNQSGKFLWAVSTGGIHDEFSYGLDVNAAKQIVVGGPFSGIADFSPGEGTHTLSAAGTTDMFALKLSACSVPGSVHTVIACDAHTWIDGKTYHESNDDSKITFLSQAGCDSLVTLNLTINKSTASTHTVTACDSYQWIDGNTYTSSNNAATFTLTNKVGCDSLVTLNLSIDKSTSATHTVIACDSYEWIDGNTYTDSNNAATFTLTNKVGCDSLVTLNLTINNSTTATHTVIACDSYEWIDGNTYTDSNNAATFTLTNKAGCDSLVTLNLTINRSTTVTDSITACDFHTWIDGNTYTDSNTSATITFTNNVGCDSIIALHLTIIEIDTTILVLPDTIFAMVDNATYRWFDCDNNDYIAHAHAQGFMPVATGNYSVEITMRGCTSQSECKQILFTGLEDSKDKVRVFPNPTDGPFSLSMDEMFTKGEIILLNSLGQPVQRHQINGKQADMNIDGPPGLYIVSIRNADGREVVMKVAKQ